MSASWRFWILFSTLMSISIGLAAINLNDAWRTTLRDYLIPNKREILAKAMGDLLGTGRAFTVLKVKNQDNINIEVYENDVASGKTFFKGRAILPERRDGLFNYKGSATNLLLLDIDNDKALEIIAPSFDENLVPRIHIYKFNDSSSSLDPISPDSLKQ